MAKVILFLSILIFWNCKNADSSSVPQATVTNETTTSENTIQPVFSSVKEIPLPSGFKRKNYDASSFGAWLREIKLKKDKTVYLYNGEKKANQTAQYAVLDVSVGDRDLQQCADAVMRLRAEYLRSKKAYADIHFNSVEGYNMRYVDWANGSHNLLKKRPATPLSKMADLTYPQFLKYMNYVFAYASTLSLEKELTPLSKVSEIEAGDVFIKGGSPGHAVIVMDVAMNEKTGKKIFLLAQSYMPAQDIHVLVNPNDTKLSPWYSETFGDELITPEWVFKQQNVRRF